MDLWLDLKSQRKVCGLWKSGQATSEDYRYVVKLCREKIRKAKAQLELNLDAKGRTTMNISINTSTARRGLGRISIPCWTLRATS